MREVVSSWKADGVFTGREPHTSKDSMKTLLATVICTLAIFSSGCGSVKESRKIRGIFKLTDSRVERMGSLCYGTGGYSDIKSGLKVVVKNERQKIIGVSSLSGDSYTGNYPGVVCEFPFVVEDLPKAKFYTIEVGRRGELTYPYDELEEQNWEVAFSLG